MAEPATSPRALTRLADSAPLLVSALATCAAIALIDQTFGEPTRPLAWLLVVPVAMGLIAIVWRQRRLAFASAAVLSLLISGHHRIGLMRQATPIHSSTLHIVEGTIVDEVKRRDITASFTLRVDKCETLREGTRLRMRSGLTEVSIGEKIALECYLQVPRGPRNPGEFDFRDYLWRSGVMAESEHVVSEKAVGADQWWRSRKVFFELRDRVRAALLEGVGADTDASILIPAAFLGERPERTDVVLSNFREAGVLHLFAVSGLHVGIVIVLIGWVLRHCGLDFRALSAVLIPLVLLYAAITGFPPAAVRAALMTVVYLGARALHCRIFFANAMALSAIVVLAVDPHQLFQAGFQLSYLVLGAIVIGGKVFDPWVRKTSQPDEFIPRKLWTRMQRWRGSAFRKVAGLAVVSVVAWIASIPLARLHFRIFTPISVLSSFLLTLPITGVLALSLLSLTVGSLVPPSRAPINAVNAALAQFTANTASRLAALPLGSYDLRHLTADSDSLVIYDLGRGRDAIALSRGDGLLIDTGDARRYRGVLHDALRDLAIDAPDVIISHPSGEAAGGALTMLKLGKMQHLYLPTETARSSDYRRLVANADSAGHPYSRPEPMIWHAVDAQTRWRALTTPSELDGNPVADNRCLVIQLEIDDFRILCMGDSGRHAEAALLGKEVDLRSDVIVYGRNRVFAGGDFDFIRTVNPTAIITANTTFPVELAAPVGWIDALRNEGFTVFDQLETGAVTLTFSDGHASIRPFIGEGEVTISPAMEK